MATLSTAKRIVIKIGSALLVHRDTGALKADWLRALAEDVARLHNHGTDVILVSSGSIALGRGVLELPEKADIWSLGALFFEIVLGRPLFSSSERRKTGLLREPGAAKVRIYNHRLALTEPLATLLEGMTFRLPHRRPSIDTIINYLEKGFSITRPPRV